MKMEKPLVSLIVTTMNNQATIDELLLSMKRQTYKNIETILVDEYSTDDTLKIARKYKVIIYRGGPERSIKRNIGIKKAKGKYIFIFDSDQKLDKNLVEDCVEKIKDFDFLSIPELPYGPDRSDARQHFWLFSAADAGGLGHGCDPATADRACVRGNEHDTRGSINCGASPWGHHMG